MLEKSVSNSQVHPQDSSALLVQILYLDSCGTPVFSIQQVDKTVLQ